MSTIKIAIVLALCCTASLYIKEMGSLVTSTKNSAWAPQLAFSLTGVPTHFNGLGRREACPQDEPPLQFNMETDIDYAKKPTCGKNKCFFKSKDAPEELGYIITDGGYFQKLKASWETSCSMGAYRHIYTAKPPILQPITGQPFQLHTGIQALKGKENKVQIFQNSTDLAILQVRVAENFVQVDCRHPRRPFFKALYQSLGSSPTATRRYIAELNQTADLLRAIPGLVFDFQMMVHRDGTIRHFDLDRFLPRDVPKKATANCICNLKMDAVLLTQGPDFLRHVFGGTRKFFHFYEERPELFEHIPECKTR